MKRPFCLKLLILSAAMLMFVATGVLDAQQRREKLDWSKPCIEINPDTLDGTTACVYVVLHCVADPNHPGGQCGVYGPDCAIEPTGQEGPVCENQTVTAGWIPIIGSIGQICLDGCVESTADLYIYYGAGTSCECGVIP